ncbi:FHA domain-containing protein, partial [Mycobacterium genavense]|uniref:FHA domain-containing protein n=1 Tax=Mycobacterium genavense TaxID=36812 RepID=UPI0012EBF230
MSRPAPPVLTIRHDGSQRTFAAGQEVIVGRDQHADLRIADPRISRAHLILRFDQGRWLAIDNGSLNGTYVNGYRMPVVDIHDGQSIHVGNPRGPRLTFAVGPQQARAGRPAQPRPTPQSGPPTIAWSALPDPPTTTSQPLPPPPRRQPQPQMLRPPKYPGRPPRPRATPPEELTVVHAARDATPPAESTVIDAKTTDVSNLATRFVRLLSPRSSSAAGTAGALTIGRAPDNDIVVPDVLASRQHATLVPTPLGLEIRDNSINGTFVNGTRVGSAILSDDDVVTIGNVDLVVRDGTLVTLGEVATRSGVLQVRDVQYVVDNGKQLLDHISLTARPGTLTAIIGGSGAGKSTLSRLIAGYSTPSSGSATFEGHNIHTEYASLRSRIGMVPQDDVVHRQLTVNQALGYAAELRLPPDTSKADREQVVAQVLEELELTKHADTRVDKLSGGQRKRASVALELLTGPSLLLLDEPTTGLDPALDRQVMMMLRQLADAGRVVLVVTHSVSYLDVCDQLLLVAPGGKTAYCGPPSQIGAAMGTTNWA